MDLAVFYTLGITLIILGLIITAAAIVLASKGSAKKSKVRAAGVVMIGPIPIVFGAGPDASWLIAASVILTVVSVVLFLVMNRRSKKFSS